MAEKKIELLQQYDFSGGVNLADDPAHLKDTEVAGIRNFTISDSTGVLVKRTGSVAVGSPQSGSPKALCRVRLGQTLYLLACVGSTLYQVNETTGAFTSLDTGLSGDDISFAAFQARLYYASKSKIRFWNGTNVDALTGQGELTGLCVHNDRLWASDGQSGLYYTPLQGAGAALSGEEPSADNMLPVADRSGQKMTGLVSHEGALLILMSHSLHYLYGYDVEEFTRKQELDGLGCIAPRSVAVGDGLIFFLSRDGVYWIQGRTVQNISEPVEPLFRKLSLTQLSQAAGMCHQHKYYLALPESTGNGTLLCVFNIQTSQKRRTPVWELHSVGGRAMEACSLEGDSGKLYALSPAAGSTSQLLELFPSNTYSDNGECINAYVETKWLLNGQSVMWYEFHELFLSVDFPQNGSMTVTWTVKQGDSTVTDTLTVTTTGRYSFPVKAQGMDIKLKLSVTDKKAWTIHGFSVRAVARRVNR